MDTPEDMPQIFRLMLEKNEDAGVDPNALQGTLMRSMSFARLLYDAFASGKPVVWINVFVPPELIFACGCTPFWMDGAGGFSGWVDLREAFERADTFLPSRDTCTFLRAAIGGVFTGMFPPPDIVVCTSHLCESSPKIGQMTARHFKKDFHSLDVPASLSGGAAGAVDYVARQIERLARRLSHLAGIDVDIDRLRLALSLSNQTRAHFVSVAENRKHIPACATGSQFIGMSLIYPWGTDDGVAIAQAFDEELWRRLSKKFSAVEGGEKNRLMWIHLRPVFETDIMNYVERELRSVVAIDVLGEIWWPELDLDDPFRALAVKMLSNPELQPMEAKIKRLIDLVRSYSVDGVVHFLHWGCRWNYGQNILFKHALAEAGVPLLALDGDAVDRRAAPYGQMVTRLEAFLELLETGGARRRT
ncbi:MAG: 2-hydroxyacyl-CoA dehydratase [Candidatus Abyssobacteria bacterium SURF_5]|uniref:2-hydroxyacyl-CoA dehydratase n=1 Tax=Abyssobacteria bacterium (strain SURF_5) TaxID=2093360 RepID=A0A3A4NMB2_ABYX5|nr:MAG: 2-hydroxyacyl-CoA dehydratase [Candidatus Abyssubacteria bacterium SURF_5]